MPEGDTVWLTAQRLQQALAGRRLIDASLRVPALASVDLRGATVTGVLARGKHLLIRLDTGLTVHSHLRMDGSWVLCRAGQRPRGLPDHLIRAQLGNSAWLATGYRVRDLRLVATGDEDHLVGHLGPDLLGPDWDQAEAVRRLGRQPQVPVGQALLDQRNLAGIGNLYRCEVLFLRGVHPWTPVSQVADLPALVATAHRLLLANRGRPEQSTTGQLSRGRQHWVYRRAGQPCLRCRTPIAAAEQGTAPRQRRTYWCPSCQPGVLSPAPAAPARPAGPTTRSRSRNR